jgi:hypothetical protein
MCTRSSHPSARAALLTAGVMLAAMVLHPPSSAGAQALGARPTLGISVIGLRGDTETGTGVGGGAQVRWPFAPNLSLIGRLAGVRIGTVDREPPETPFFVFSARSTVLTAVAGIETSRNAGTLRPYAALAGGLSMVRTKADVVAVKQPVGQSVSDVRRIESAPWGAPSPLAPTLVVGGGVRVHLPRGFIVDAGMSRFEAGRTTWAESPGFGAAPDLRRRTSAWLVQAGAEVRIGR